MALLSLLLTAASACDLQDWLQTELVDQGGVEPNPCLLDPFRCLLGSRFPSISLFFQLVLRPFKAF